MMRSLRLLTALALPALLAAGTGRLQAAERPPQNLHLVGDHWTAWDPPSTFPEGAEVYTIVRGDTLWDLAARFYGDPYLWPQLWERNQYILDAHWIYPGDPLVVSLEVTPVEDLGELEEEVIEEVAEVPPEDGEGEEVGLAVAAPVRPPTPLGSESDIYCTGYIGELDEPFGYRIIGSEYENLSPSLQPGRYGEIVGLYGVTDTIKVGMTIGDIVYLDGGLAGGLAPGMVFTAVWPDQLVVHPGTGEVTGRFYRYLGRVRVLSVQEETAIAEITGVCAPVLVGARLEPFEPVPVPLARRTAMRPVNEPASPAALEGAPTIIYSEAGLVSLGADHVVFIDRGAEDDVTPGDMYTIYRTSQREYPPLVLGELAVLSVHERTALAKILESRYTVYVGDRLEPK